MRILQVCNKPPYPPRDGGSIAMFNLADALNKLGHNLTILTMHTGKHRLSDEQLLEYPKTMKVHSVYVDTTPHRANMLFNLIFSQEPYNACRFVSTDFEIKMKSLLKDQIFDVVQLEGLYLTPYIRTIRQYSEALIALRAHNIEHEIWERVADQERNLFKKLYFRNLAKRIRQFECNHMNACDLLIPITNRDLEQFNRLGNIRPAFVCPAGVNTCPDTTINPNSRGSVSGDLTEPLSLFFIGSLDWIPNQEGLLWFISEVFPLLQQQFPYLKLHVAGRNAPDKLARRINLPGVLYYGEVEDAREFMRSKSILVSPCFSGSGMRLKIVEAMALGKPVVTTPIGAEGLAVEHDKNIMIANNSSEFCQYIERLMKYPDLCQRIGLYAHEFVNTNYNNRIIAEGLADFYEEHLK